MRGVLGLLLLAVGFLLAWLDLSGRFPAVASTGSGTPTDTPTDTENIIRPEASGMNRTIQGIGSGGISVQTALRSSFGPPTALLKNDRIAGRGLT